MNKNDYHELDAMRLVKAQDTDALKWAKSFNYHAEQSGAPTYDEGVLLAWFANAMCVQMDSTANKMREKIDKLKSLILFTDPILSSEECGGEIQLKQWSEYARCFPEDSGLRFHVDEA